MSTTEKYMVKTLAAECKYYKKYYHSQTLPEWAEPFGLNRQKLVKIFRGENKCRYELDVRELCGKVVSTRHDLVRHMVSVHGYKKDNISKIDPRFSDVEMKKLQRFYRNIMKKKASRGKAEKMATMGRIKKRHTDALTAGAAEEDQQEEFMTMRSGKQVNFSGPEIVAANTPMVAASGKASRLVQRPAPTPDTTSNTPTVAEPGKESRLAQRPALTPSTTSNTSTVAEPGKESRLAQRPAPTPSKTSKRGFFSRAADQVRLISINDLLGSGKFGST